MIKGKPFIVTLAGLVVLLGASTAFAQSGTKTSTAEKSTTKAVSTQRIVSDMSFAKMAAAGGEAEVKLGQLAEEKGTTPTVKDFGKRMVTDHTKVDDELKTTASKDNIALPSGMSAKDQATYNQLSKLSGDAFDRAYARDMVRDHEADIAAFRTEAKDGKNASIKGFASQTLPTLQEHLKLAQQMMHSTSATNAGSTKKSSS